MKIFHTAEYGLVNIVALMELEIHHLKTISVKIDLDKNHYVRQIGGERNRAFICIVSEYLCTNGKMVVIQ